MNNNDILPGSFRDPSGFIFTQDGDLYRQINKRFKDHFDAFESSGLYLALTAKGLLVKHVASDCPPKIPDISYKVIKPEKIPYISYPYEWCFSQLKDAALKTLDIQDIALDHGMTLKDASAYNIQFDHGRTVFIDTLSFEKYDEGCPWVAYGQFCRHFLAPLSLMAYRDIRLNQLGRSFIDGIPLDLAGKLLPKRSYLRLPIYIHIHLHSRSRARYGKTGGGSNAPVKKNMSPIALRGLIDSLRSAVQKLKWAPPKTEWGDYYEDTNYSSDAMRHKKELVGNYIKAVSPASVWDLGANTGEFSKDIAERGIPVVSFDVDPLAVEKNYIDCKKRGEKNILPLILDLTNPTSSAGWGNTERDSFIGRGPADTVLALALIHHLAISNNVPFGKLASFFSHICSSLIIEYVPKDDSQVQRLLASREDIFRDYSREQFEKDFRKFFKIEKFAAVRGSKRIIYLMIKI